jgi:hypothetical protein
VLLFPNSFVSLYLKKTTEACLEWAFTCIKLYLKIILEISKDSKYVFNYVVKANLFLKLRILSGQPTWLCLKVGLNTVGSSIFVF